MPDQRAPTPSQTIGPFFGFALPFAGDADAGGPTPVRIEGFVFDGAGEAVPDAILEIWHPDAFVRCATDAFGRFQVILSKPSPTSGPNGSTQAPHLEVSVFGRGLLRQLATRIYFPDEENANATDPTLSLIDPARRATLVARRDEAVLLFDVHLQGEHETVFFVL